MTQLGPSPHLAHMNRGGMLPPNGPQGMNPQGSMSSAQNSMPAQSFSQLGRPPSRAATPGQNSMTQPSPSMGARQIPSGIPGGGDMRQAQQDQGITIELQRIPNSILIQCMQDAGIGDKDLLACKLEEKVRSIF